MQSLYYKGSSKHVLIDQLGTGTEREKIQTNKEEHFKINKE